MRLLTSIHHRTRRCWLKKQRRRQNATLSEKSFSLSAKRTMSEKVLTNKQPIDNPAATPGKTVINPMIPSVPAGCVEGLYLHDRRSVSTRPAETPETAFRQARNTASINSPFLFKIMIRSPYGSIISSMESRRPADAVRLFPTSPPDSKKSPAKIQTVSIRCLYTFGI